MKRMLLMVGLLIGLAAGAAQAQTRVGVSLSFGDPNFHGHVVVGRPYYHRYSRPYYHRYRPTRVIVVEPRYYRSRVVVVRPHGRHHARRYHRYHRNW